MKKFGVNETKKEEKGVPRMTRWKAVAVLVALVALCAYPALAQVELKVGAEPDTNYRFEPTEPILAAADTFELIELFAIGARDHAADLKSYFLQPASHSWLAHAEKLTRVRADVNDIADQLERLHALEISFLPRQKLALDHIMPDAAVLAANTAEAIEFLNENQGTRWDADYELYVSEIYRRADSISQAAGMTESRLNVQSYLENLSR